MNVTLGFTRGVWHNNAYNPQGVNDPLSELGFPSYLDSNGFKGVPTIYLDLHQIRGIPVHGQRYVRQHAAGAGYGTLTATLDKVHGAHELKFGFDGRMHQINYIQTNAANGIFSFDENGSVLASETSRDCGGDDLASF